MDMTFFSSIIDLFYPKTCVHCHSNLLLEETILCTNCRFDLPMIENYDFQNNEISQVYAGRILLEKAGAFLYFRKRGITRNLIHELKYKGNQEIGSFLGNWFGYLLQQSGAFGDIDLIIPVPLHPKKQKIRGYNQLTTFGQALGKQLGTIYSENFLTRVSKSKTQTFKTRLERFSNANTKFEIQNMEELEGKHILLIDDVITTGATLESCYLEFVKIPGISISIITMAYTE